MAVYTRMYVRTLRNHRCVAAATAAAAAAGAGGGAAARAEPVGREAERADEARARERPRGRCRLRSQLARIALARRLRRRSTCARTITRYGRRRSIPCLRVHTHASPSTRKLILLCRHSFSSVFLIFVIHDYRVIKYLILLSLVSIFIRVFTLFEV